MKKISVTFALVLFSLSLAPALAGAQTGGSGNGFPTGGSINSGPTGGSDNSIFQLQNPLGSGTNSFCKLMQALLKIFVIFGIPIATFFLMYAGFKLVLARGNPEALRKARTNLFYVLVGIAIFLGAVTLGQIIAATISDLGFVPGINGC